MGLFGHSGGGVWRSACCAALVCVCAAQTGTKQSHPQPAPWDAALAARADFEEQPAGTHTKAEYNQVMDGFRAIYHANPRDPHAAEAVKDVAELLAEQGRELNDPAALANAQGQYAFLEKQYPGTKAAREAKLAAAQLQASSAVPAPTVEVPPHRDAAVMNGARKKPEPAVAGLALTEENARAVEASEATVAPPTNTNSPAAPPDDRQNPEPKTKTVKLAQVTGIRHWSTSTYTRVAIDLGDAVTFQAARVPNPDRIYFDLHGAKLGAELVGKSFSVTDDGFLKRIRAAQSSPDVTRVVLDVNDVTDYSAFLLPNPYRLIIDIHGGNKARGATLDAQAEAPKPQVASAPVTATDPVRASAAANSSGLPAMAPTDGGVAVPTPPARPEVPHATDARRGTPGTGWAPVVRVVPNTVAEKTPAASAEVAAVSDAPGKIEANSAPTSQPISEGVPVATNVNLGIGKTSRRRKPRSADPDADLASSSAAAPAKAADKTADGETSMIRALGLKIGRIVIDAGHGGHDSGTLGVDGIEEKDVVLDVALRLGKLLHDRLGAEIIYTRSDDTFIPLETRTAIANKAQADLFLSIHANSSQDASARGVETYYLNFTSDPSALDVAARENAVGGQSIHQLSDLVKKITLKDKIAESREFASDVEGSLYAGLQRGNEGLKNRGVKKAPFVVLIGANMPSILAEISFVTNPKDAAQLRQPDYRQRVAQSLFEGVAKYESGLAGSRGGPVQRASLR